MPKKITLDEAQLLSALSNTLGVIAQAADTGGLDEAECEQISDALALELTIYWSNKEPEKVDA